MISFCKKNRQLYFIIFLKKIGILANVMIKFVTKNCLLLYNMSNAKNSNFKSYMVQEK